MKLRRVRQRRLRPQAGCHIQPLHATRRIPPRRFGLLPRRTACSVSSRLRSPTPVQPTSARVRQSDTKETTEMIRKIHRNPPRPLGQLATRLVPLEESLTQVASFHLAQIIPPRPSPPNNPSGDTIEVVLVQPADRPERDHDPLARRANYHHTGHVQGTRRRSHEDLGVRQHPAAPRSGLNGDVDWLDGGLWQTD
jgi:hypothetical protein